jgi:hypothetical protein
MFRILKKKSTKIIHIHNLLKQVENVTFEYNAINTTQMTQVVHKQLKQLIT